MRVAAVQSAPVWMSRSATIDKVVDLVKEASEGGAELVAFSETHVPGYPWWLMLDSLPDVMNRRHHVARQAWYLREGVNIGRGDLNPIVNVARDQNVFVSVGVAELAPTGGSIYCSMVMIHPGRGIVGIHRKIKPTTTERLSWADGDGHGLRVHDWAGWKIGGLNCWENWLPIPRFTLYSQGEQIHIASWPGGTALTPDITRFVAVEGGLFSISVCGLFGAENIPANYPGGDSFIDALSAGSPFGDGGTMIVDPTGRVLASADQGKEQIIYADIELDLVLSSRVNRDPAGHYHRPDLFEVTVNRSRPSPVSFA